MEGGVRLSHGQPGEWSGTSWLEATGDTLDLTRFHDLVCAQAAALAALGDTDSLEVRKAKALGVIADQQATLDLLTLTDTTVSDAAASSARSTSRSMRRAKTTLFMHMSWADLLGLADGPTGIGAVERLGPATIARIKEWVGHSRVTIQPVLDLGRTDAVDVHDPPEWMRELVILRDRHCVFPWCGRDARSCDLDHIVPYDEHGPPGQTNPENLAPLCRRHHRAKTAGRWRYRRSRDSTYLWQGPHGRTHLVTPTGTLELHPN